MSSRPNAVLRALRQPRVALAAASAVLALLAWAVGRAAAHAWTPIDFWPLAATMLGWLAVAPGGVAANGREASTTPPVAQRREGMRLRGLAALGAGLTVFGAECAQAGPAAGFAAAAAGVGVPLLGATLLARLAALSPPRGMGNTELRLLGAAIAFAPLATVLRLAPHGLLQHPPVDALLGDLLAATVFASLGAALARPVAARIVRRPAHPAAGARTAGSTGAGSDADTEADTARIPRARLAMGLVVFAACVGGAWALRAAGLAEFARVVAVLHLVLGLFVAMTMHGPRGAVALAINSVAMAIGFTAAFAPDRVDAEGAAIVRELATLTLMGSVFALQSILNSLSSDSRQAARMLIRQALRSDLSWVPKQQALARIVDAMLARPGRGRFWLIGVVLPDIARWSDLLDSAATAELERSVLGRLRSTFEPLGSRVLHPSSGRFLLLIGDRIDGLRIRQLLRSTLGDQRFETNEHTIQLRYHAGMVEIPPDTGVGSAAVLTSLSMSLQRAANDPAGIHRATVSPELVDGYRTELRTIEAVSRALTEGRIHLFAERIDPAGPSRDTGLHYEVLSRVEGEDGRLLQPGQFLPAVWHAGLHGKLDRLVFTRTIASLAADRPLHDATRLCSINVCGPTLCDPEFPDYVQRCLATHAVDPRRLMIEITESTAIADLELARAHVLRLAELGVAVGLDDFGTGLATFDYLKRLRASVLKIDGSFVRRIVEDPLDREIVASIVRMARATGAKTVAEWIETAEQRAIVAALGVDYVQGRLVAAPVPIAQIARTRAAAIAGLRVASDDEAITPRRAHGEAAFYQHGGAASERRAASAGLQTSASHEPSVALARR